MYVSGMFQLTISNEVAMVVVTPILQYRDVSRIRYVSVSDTAWIRVGYVSTEYPEKNKSTIIQILFMDTLTLCDMLVQYDQAHQQLVG